MLQLRTARAARIFVTFIWRNLKNKTVNILRLILSTSWSYHIVTYHSDSFSIFSSNPFARNTYASATGQRYLVHNLKDVVEFKRTNL